MAAESRVAIVSTDRRMLLIDVVNAISQFGKHSILAVNTLSHKNGLATMEFTVQATGDELAAIVAAARAVEGVRQAFELQTSPLSCRRSEGAIDSA